jgi:hypothetical protein
VVGAVHVWDAAGELFAECAISEFPSPKIEQVSDSSRYFVIQIADGSGTPCSPLSCRLDGHSECRGQVDLRSSVSALRIVAMLLTSRQPCKTTSSARVMTSPLRNTHEWLVLLQPHKQRQGA